MSPIEFLILILVSLLLLSIIGYGVGIWLMGKRLRSELDVLRESLKDLQSALKEIREKRDEFEQYAEEPFLTSLMDIDKEIEKLQGKIRDYQLAYANLRSQYPQTSKMPSRKVYQKWDLAFLYRLLKQTEQLLNDKESIEEELGGVKVRFDEIKEFPWSVALQARELMEYCRQAQKILQEGAALGLCGASFDEALNEARQIQEETGKLPVFFFSEERDRLLQMATMDDLRWGYEVTHRALPRVVQIIQNADRWKNQLLSYDLEIEIARNELGKIENELKYFPEGVDSKEIYHQLSEWKKQLQGFIEGRDRLDVEELTTVSSRLSHFVQTIKEEQGKIRVLRRVYSSFETTLSQIEKIKSAIEQIYSASEQPPGLILVWDESKPNTDRQFGLYQRIRDVPKPYPREALGQLGQQAANCYQVLRKAEGRIREHYQIFEHLKELVQSKEIQEGQAFLAKVKTLGEQIGVYDVRNWPNKDWVIHLEENRVIVEEQFHRLMEQLKPGGIVESRVEEITEEFERLSKGLKTLMERVEVIENVFQAIKNTEIQSHDLLKQGRTQFTQIIPLVKSNPLLSEKCEKELVQLDRQFDLREEELRQRGKDVVAKKYKRIQQVIHDVEEAGNRWLQIVENDTGKLWNDLSQKVMMLEQIAPLTDGSMHRAREILGKRYDVIEAGRTAHPYYPLDQLVGTMKRLFDYWNECSSVRSQVEEEIEKPVLAIYQECQRYRQEAQRRFSHIQTILPQKRQWPPSSVVLSLEKNELQQLEEKWNSIHSQPTSAIQVVRSLSDLQGGYRSLVEKLIQYEQWAVQEQERIEQLEMEIHRLDRLWEIQGHRFRHFPELEGQIRDLRGKYQAEVHSVRQYWISNASRRTAAVDYDIVLKRLIEISRNMANAKVYYVNEEGKTEALDINGQVVAKNYG